MYAPASFKAARRETPAGRLFSGVDFSGEIPYHRSILSSAVRCGKWSEQDSREELLIPSARRPSASPAPPAGSRGWQNWYSGKMEESGFDEVQTDRCGSVLGRIRGRRPPPVWAGAAPCVRRFPFVRLCRPAEGGTESGLHKILRSFPVFYYTAIRYHGSQGGSPMYNILICDDEQDIVNALKIYLANPDYHLLEAHTGQEALDALERKDIHLVLLDIMMPEMDGITALAKLRQVSNVPVILLTAKSEDTDKILGLNVGADDYITKPFNPVEVAARVRSQLRRYFQLGGGALRPEVLTLGTIQMDDREKTVAVDGDPVALTPTEYDILKLLLEHPGQVFSPREIYRKVWKDAPFGSENTVAVHIRHLREKIEIDPAEPRYLKVVWGQGYKLEKGMRT